MEAGNGYEAIEEKHRSQMVALAKTLDKMFNGEIETADERHTGFILMVFPVNRTEGRCNYITNGLNPDQLVALLKDQIDRFENEQ